MSQASSMISILTLAGTPNSPASARRHVADVLRGWKSCSEETVETTRLVVSELVTNAIRHPRTAAGSLRSDPESTNIVELMVEATDSVVRISVRDRDPTPPRLREVGVEAAGGRGIFLVASLSARWGHHPCRPGPGKVVWAEVPLLSDSTVGSSRSLAVAFPAPSTPPPELARHSRGGRTTSAVPITPNHSARETAARARLSAGPCRPRESPS